MVGSGVSDLFGGVTQSGDGLVIGGESGNLLLELNNLNIALIAIICSAVVVKVVAICIQAQQSEENGGKSLWEKIKRVVIVGIIAICITGFAGVVSSYYMPESNNGQHTSAGNYSHGGGGGHH